MDSEHTMKVGDKVRVVRIPEVLPDDTMGTRALFELCLNRDFAIAGFQDGLLELEIGEVLGKPDYMHSVWIEREYVERVENESSP